MVELLLCHILAMKLPDKIYIRDLALRCIIGLYPEERATKQEVIINVVLTTDLRKAGRSDAIHDTVDYHAVQCSIIDAVERSEFKLIESLAEQIAEICLNAKVVSTATVTIDKPGALRFCKSVAVEIIRP